MREVSEQLRDATNAHAFSAPVTHVYNPLDYAWEPHAAYLRFARKGVKALWLGMNPGPFGMAQTGVPFGDVTMVRDWMGIKAPVGKPEPEHPKRPVEGFACPRSEVSGTRLWGWARDRYKTPDAFFSKFFVWNYCPLCFLEESGRNRTPDKLPVAEREPLEEACNDALRQMVFTLEPEWVIGVGQFAEYQAKAALSDMPIQIGRILHPSPASPAANRGWAAQAEKQVEALGLL